MCYWTSTKNVREQIENQIKSGTQDEFAQLFYEAFISNNSQDFKEQYVAIGKGKPTLTILANDNGNFQFKNVRWTLPLTYVDKNGKTVTRELLNSTCERVFFQHKDIIFDKRCIVPINGYFEYYHFNGETYPHYIYPKDGIFYAGGIWKEIVNEGTGEIIPSLSIITTPPNALTKKIHNNPDAPNGSRMLLLIPQDKVMEYLNPTLNQSQIKGFFNPLDANEMLAYPVIRFQRKEFTQYLNTPKLLETCEYPELVA